MAVLAFGVAGTFVELLLLGHYEEWRQLAPLVLTGFAMVGLAWHTAGPSAGSVRALQGLMTLLQAKAPPALAPGTMVQLGVIGLVGLHHHAAVKGSET